MGRRSFRARRVGDGMPPGVGWSHPALVLESECRAGSGHGCRGRRLRGLVYFETTGFRGLTTDRVVEVGVVCLDRSGELADEWTTLVNPDRDVSAGHIHGITARDVYGAPLFAEVAGVLADSLRGRVLVAHNLSFEAQFLTGEFARLGHDLQLERECGICTMTLASTYLPQSPRNLGACCLSCGLETGDAHSALADARAATGLLCHAAWLPTTASTSAGPSGWRPR